MKPHFNCIFTLLMITLFAIPAVNAGEEKKMVVAIATDSFTLEETDISSLAVGEARTIETESGQVIGVINGTRHRRGNAHHQRIRVHQPGFHQPCSDVIRPDPRHTTTSVNRPAEPSVHVATNRGEGLLRPPQRRRRAEDRRPRRGCHRLDEQWLQRRRSTC